MTTAKTSADNLECGGKTPLSFGETCLAIQSGDVSPLSSLPERQLSLPDKQYERAAKTRALIPPCPPTKDEESLRKRIHFMENIPHQLRRS